MKMPVKEQVTKTDKQTLSTRELVINAEKQTSEFRGQIINAEKQTLESWELAAETNEQPLRLNDQTLTADPQSLKPEFQMLFELLDQNQFELADEHIIDSPGILDRSASRPVDLRVIYLMNDAVESFLILKDCIVRGNYCKNFAHSSAFLDASLEMTEHGAYILILHQENEVSTFIFRDLELEVHLYNYSVLGHFWVPGHEELRLLEYQLAILRDKRDYLGEKYCTKAELELAVLTEFPPLNYCCYPSAPPEYIVPAYPKWQVSEKALDEMIKLAAEVNDDFLVRILKAYGRISGKIKGQNGKSTGNLCVDSIEYQIEEPTGSLCAEPIEGQNGELSGRVSRELFGRRKMNTGTSMIGKCIALFLAFCFRRSPHYEVIDLINRKLTQTAAKYPDRIFAENLNTGNPDEMQKSGASGMRQAMVRMQELEKQGYFVRLIREEPFTISRDEIGFKTYLLIHQKMRGNKKSPKVTVEEYD